ncbi:MAG TPA: ABC transporter ATP-binding protein [Acetobacteraceae bacterium]|jgi:ABC-type branched-subunit amino acid transport system ATPase component|nr:ABC transporter ATP-binding protein [Acetobacteraceae bacterium]
MTPLLRTRGLTRHYSGVVAVDGVDLDVAAGSIHAVIGPNGAGKTTLFNLLSGLVRPNAGTILFDGADITTLPPDRRARLGIARTFQNIRIFGAMTVLENVLTGLCATGRSGLAGTVLRLGRFRREERDAVARARDALALVGLSDKAEWRAAALSYGDQRRLEIARAAAAGPKLMLVDEPAAGMNPAETDGLVHLMQRLNALGITILLVEHDMGLVMGIAHNITVLNFGRRIFGGSPDAVRQDPGVIEAYLGHKVAARLAAARV